MYQTCFCCFLFAKLEVLFKWYADWFWLHHFGPPVMNQGKPVSCTHPLWLPAEPQEIIRTEIVLFCLTVMICFRNHHTTGVQKPK